MIYLNLLNTDADRDVFQKLFAENEQIFFLTAVKLLQNEADAEDAVQSCFLKMIENFETYQHRPYEELVKIGHTIVRHNAIDMLRSKQRKANFTDENYQWEEHTSDMAPDILTQIVQKYERSLVQQALKQMTSEERGILSLQYAEELKPKEIAKLLGISPSAVRKKTMKCRNKFAKILEGLENESL